MRPLAAAVALALALGGCSASQDAAVTSALRSQPGQLFCAFQLAGGGELIAGLINAEASAAAPAAAPVAIVATGAAQAEVDADCAAAAKAVGAIGAVPVAPPPDATRVPQVAIVAPTGAKAP